MNTHTVGNLAYYDSFSGLIPCKVISITDALKNHPELKGCSSGCRVVVKLTASCRAYKRGEVIESDALKIVPRSHVRGLRSMHSTPRIIGGYRWTQPAPAPCPEIHGEEPAHDLTAYDIGADF